jgi:hypothetical protein
MGPLEFLTIILLGIVLGVKWFTTLHSTRLSEGLVVAENDEARFRGRYKKLVGEREAIARETKDLTITYEAMEAQIQDMEEDLFDVDQRNGEIKEQIEHRG